MSHKVFAKDCETLSELTDWAKGHIFTAEVVEIDGEIVIKTGLTTSMGGYLYLIAKEEESE